MQGIRRVITAGIRGRVVSSSIRNNFGPSLISKHTTTFRFFSSSLSTFHTEDTTDTILVQYDQLMKELNEALTKGHFEMKKGVDWKRHLNAFIPNSSEFVKEPLHKYFAHLSRLIVGRLVVSKDMKQMMLVVEKARRDFIPCVNNTKLLLIVRQMYAEAFVQLITKAIVIAGQTKHVAEIGQLWDILIQSGLQPNSYTFANVVQACLANLRYREAEYYLNLYPENAPYSTDMFRAIMKFRFMKRQFKQVFYLYLQMTRLSRIRVEDRHIFVMVLDALRRAELDKEKSIKSIKAIAADIEQVGFHDDIQQTLMSHVVITAIHVDITAGTSIMNEYLQRGMKVDKYLFAKLMQGHLTNSKDVEGITALWEYSRANDIELDSYGLDAALYAASVSKHSHVADEIWKIASRPEFEATLSNPRFYGKLMLIYAYHGNLERAEELYQHLLANNSRVTMMFFFQRLNVYLHAKNKDILKYKALDILTETFERINAMGWKYHRKVLFNFAYLVALESNDRDAFEYVYDKMITSTVQPSRSAFATYYSESFLVLHMLRCVQKFYSPESDRETLTPILSHITELTLNALQLERRKMNKYPKIREMYLKAQFLLLTLLQKYDLKDLHSRVYKSLQITKKLRPKPTHNSPDLKRQQ